MIKVRFGSGSGVHIASKITIGAGALLLLAGIAMLVLAGSSIGDAGSDWAAEETTGGTLKIVDEDGNGDLGFAFFVKGEYADDDGDGEWDHCSGVEITVKQKPAVNTDWDDIEEEGGNGERGSSTSRRRRTKGTPAMWKKGRI